MEATTWNTLTLCPPSPATDPPTVPLTASASFVCGRQSWLKIASRVCTPSLDSSFRSWWGGGLRGRLLPGFPRVHLLKGRCLPLGGAHMTWGPQVHSWGLRVCLGTEDQLPTRMQVCPSSSKPYCLQLLCVDLCMGCLLALQTGGSTPDGSH